MQHLKLFAVLSLLLTATLQAGIVYDNGAPNGVASAEMTRYMQAEEVTPSSSITFNKFRFWTIEPTGGTSWNGTIVWVINQNFTPGDFPHYNQVPISPGPISRTFVQSMGGGYDEYQIDLSLVTPVTLAAGTTVWFSLHNGNYSEIANETFYWESTNSNGTLYNSYNFDRQATPAPGPWVSNGGTELAYQLIYDESLATPEPGTWAMLATGAVGLLALRRRSTSSSR